MRATAALVALLTPAVAWATPAPLTSPVLPPVLPGVTVALQPFVTVPPEAGASAAPLARIQYATPSRDGAGSLFINDLSGAVYRSGATGGATPWLDVGAVLGAAAVNNGDLSHGLMSIAFHPNFNGDPAQPGYGKFYTSTNGAAGAATIGSAAPDKLQAAITEWTTDPKAATYAAVAPPRLVMQIGGYTDGHSNGLIAFNPRAARGTLDYGALYVGSGDGLYNDGNQNAQSLAVPQGKMLRINPLQAGAQAYTIPADNPFRAKAGALPEIWATGLRYPQSFSWDLATGAMYINDLGQAEIEEVNRGIAGANYGWSQREGTYATGYAYGTYDENIYPVTADAAPGGPYTDPIAELEHLDGASFALGSGFVYRGTAIPALQGMYVMQDVVSGNAYYFDPAAIPAGGQAPVHALNLTLNGVPVALDQAFGYDNYYSHRVDARLGQDENGELYTGLKSNGVLFELSATAVPEPGTLALLALPAAFGLVLRHRSAG